ncbi:MAG: prepilin-type N-terminal cleavage/methylation domain-containing protein [Chloracidobacterium sp.]|nr:prepilin-type N-terminal cleavage/methylation domain-containing protein [Chloracidobacterium sp.]
MSNKRFSAAQKGRGHSGQAGYSMIELLAAMVVFLVVTGSIFGVLQVARQSRGAVSNQVQLTKSVRLGLNLIGRDTYNAGYGYPLKHAVVIRNNRIGPLLGIPADTDTSRDMVPPIIAGNNLTVNTWNQTPNVRTDQITFLFKDSTFNLIGPAASAVSQPLNINPATTTSTGIDEIVPVVGSNASVRVNDLLLVTGNSGSALGVVTGLNGSEQGPVCQRRPAWIQPHRQFRHASKYHHTGQYDPCKHGHLSRDRGRDAYAPRIREPAAAGRDRLHR